MRQQAVRYDVICYVITPRLLLLLHASATRRYGHGACGFCRAVVSSMAPSMTDLTTGLAAADEYFFGLCDAKV